MTSCSIAALNGQQLKCLTVTDEFTKEGLVRDCQNFRVRAMTMGRKDQRMARRKRPNIPDELLDQLLAGRDAGAALGPDGLINELKRALAERALNAEMDTIWMARWPRAGPTAATATATRRCSPTAASWRSRCRATDHRPSLRS
jgi:RecB family exonuclease